ncbi:MAG: ABC transporter permease [Candidatus Taylorbacteria bacterium]|nr:ABC transporter permease [Candidatus Taylorbacteria bacterium]
MKTIYILWLRQIKRYLRSKSRIVGSLVQPMLFLVALGFGLGPVFQKAGQGNYVEFLVPGIIGMGIIFTSIFSGMEIIWDRQFGFLKETLVAPVTRLNIMVGRTLGGATVATSQGIIILLMSLVVGFRLSNWLLAIPAVVIMFLTAFLFTALGTAIASKIDDMQGFQLIVNFLIMPLFFLSGALFPLNNLPKSISIIANLDPLTYGIDALRYFLAGAGANHFGVGIDIVVLTSVTLLFLGVGSYLFNKIQI